MGLPYSRQINAAFEQVTPLVAAGFKVLRTTRDISILLAVIQVLTVLFLALILLALIAILYCVNPDLETERQQLVTPCLQYIASFTLRGIVRSIITCAIIFGAGTGLVWRLLVVKRWVEDVEYQGNVDAEHALEELDGYEEDEEDEEMEKMAEEGMEAAIKEEEKKKGKGKGKKK